MNNRENYKKAVEQIHASEELKQKTFEKMKNKNEKKSNIIGFKVLSAVAIFLIVFSVGYKNFEKENILYGGDKSGEDLTLNTEVEELPRFKNIEELREILKENNNSKGGIYTGMFATNGLDTVATAEESMDSKSRGEYSLDSTQSSTDFSKTNNQVENADEADVVKTDGKYIYYISNGILNIVDANNLELLSEIKGYRTKNNAESFTPYNLFINGNKIVLIGNYSISEKNSDKGKDDILYDYAYINYTEMAKAIVYDVSDRKNPQMLREVALDGYYKDARMIGDNIYLISTKGIYYYWKNELKDEDILPVFYDSVRSAQNQTIQCTNIAYFPNLESHTYTLIGGFNINNNEALNVETFFGAGDTIYCSENNLYLTQTMYDKENYSKNTVKIYKFELNNSKVIIRAEGEVEGYVNNQFSLDEYDGNLRIATTVIVKPWEFNEETGEYSEEKTVNRVYILNEKLEEISRIDNMAFGEKIYAVRFIGKVGYVVTFEQVDPLFVLDLSNPKKPEIKGELKIPGYSSYLHPYDENHIIGIGYNTKSNGYGGITNANMKMSMFDISDLSNPIEMFSTDIGLEYTYSELINDHKGLFYKASDNLIGFAYNTYESYSSKDYWAFDIFHIDLEKGFENFARFTQDVNYTENIRRMIYIDNTLYGLSQRKITSYDLNTQKLQKELKLNTLYDEDYYIDAEEYYNEDEDVSEEMSEENIIYYTDIEQEESKNYISEEEFFPNNNTNDTILITMYK